ncbi:hypothetical protein BKA93DRAFT_783990 [Sparassis latifolia]
MPPHRALQVYDILREIFQYIAPTSGSHNDPVEVIKANRTTLSGAARVCVAFLDPALDVLWDELDSIQPALRLLPAVEIAEPLIDLRVDDHSYYLKSDITPQRWARFHYYANRVHKIFFFSGPSPDTRDAVLMKLTELNGDQPLLPFLQRLYYVHAVPYDTTILSFVSPSLQYLALYYKAQSREGQRFGRPELAFSSVLTAVSAKAPQLKTFYSSGIPHPISLAAITASRHLTNIEIDPRYCDADLMRALSALEELQVLKIELYSLGANFVCRRGFASLRVLTANGPLRNVIMLLEAITSPHLRTLRMVGEERSNDFSRPWRRCTATIAAQFPGLHVLQLQLQDLVYAKLDFDADIEIEGELVDPENAFTATMQPLMALRDLRDIELVLRKPLSPSTDTLVEIGQSWSKLTSFRLMYEFVDGGTTIDPRFLVDFVSFSPSLTNLALPSVDFKLLVPLPLFAPVSYSLKTLDLGHRTFSTLEDVDAVARFLHKYFPALDLNDGLEYEEHRSEHTRRWTTEQFDWENVLQVLAAYRKEENSMDVEDEYAW